MLIEFRPPSIEVGLRNYSRLPGLLQKATSAIGTYVSIGEHFSIRGVRELEQIIEVLRPALENTMPRIIQSYALVFWFTLEVKLSTLVSYGYRALHN